MNQILWSILATLIIVQFTKVIVRLYHKKPISWKNYVQTGGMPSSHSALVTSLAIGVALTEGVNSASFAITLVVALIVLRDAIGVRRTVGELTETVKRLTRKANVHEAPGHTPLEVAVGIIVGTIVTIVVFAT